MKAKRKTKVSSGRAWYNKEVKAAWAEHRAKTPPATSGWERYGPSSTAKSFGVCLKVAAYKEPGGTWAAWLPGYIYKVEVKGFPTREGAALAVVAAVKSKRGL